MWSPCTCEVKQERKVKQQGKVRVKEKWEWKKSESESKVKVKLLRFGALRSRLAEKCQYWQNLSIESQSSASEAKNISLNNRERGNVLYMICPSSFLPARSLTSKKRVIQHIQYRQKNPLLTLSTTKYQAVPNHTDTVTPSTSQYRPILTECHQSFPLIFFLFTTHLMSHAQYTWSS